MHQDPRLLLSTCTLKLLNRSALDWKASSFGRSALAGAGLTLVLGGCAGEVPTPIARGQQALDSDNGLSINGLSINGLSINGLSVNGLSINGLSTASFSSWFNQDLTLSAMVMSYIVKCAKPSGTQMSWQNPATGAGYTWAGELGLTPNWSAGQPATLPEQQVISACLAAHANKYGVHVPIAVEGLDATGTQLPIGPGELQTYNLTEGCFFGNLFNGEGVFAGSGASLEPNQTSLRACALDYAGHTDPDCSPIVHVGKCSDHCTIDHTHTYYTQCTYNGKIYLPLATRMQKQGINVCGDGICQVSESCGNANGGGICQKDCGTCP